MGYVAEKKALQELVSEDVWQLLKDAQAIIAGGAITSIFTNKDVNDIDVYFRSEEQLFRTVAAIYNLDEYTDYVELPMFELVYMGSSQRTLMFKHGEQDIQFMTFKWFSDVGEVFDTFDFTCCMGAYDFAVDDFVLHKNFMQHNAQRYLKFHAGTDYPIMSLMRVDKYRQKGYSISKTELLRVVGACMNLNMKTWDDVKEHVGGMYGYDLNDVFNEDVAFSMDEFINQLDGIVERDIRKVNLDISKGNGFWDIVKIFCTVPQEAKIIFDDSKYLYKCVDKDFKLPLASYNKKIKYEPGSVISTKDNGVLYFHNSSTDPFRRTDYWVEVELIYGSCEQSDFYACKRVIDGVFRVNRCFEYRSGSDYKQDYLAEKYKIGG